MFTSSSPCCKDQFAVSYFSYKFNCTDLGLQLGDPAPLIGLLLWTFWHFIHFEFFSPICDRILNGVPLDCREILIKNWFGTKKKKKINTNLRSNERSHLRGHVNQFIDVLLIFPTVSFCALHGCAHVTVLFGDDSDLAYSCARRWAGLHFGKPLSLHLLQGKHQQSLKAASIPCLRIWSTCYCVFLCGRRL